MSSRKGVGGAQRAVLALHNYGEEEPEAEMRCVASEEHVAKPEGHPRSRLSTVPNVGPEREAADDERRHGMEF